MESPARVDHLRLDRLFGVRAEADQASGLKLPKIAKKKPGYHLGTPALFSSVCVMPSERETASWFKP